VAFFDISFTPEIAAASKPVAGPRNPVPNNASTITSEPAIADRISSQSLSLATTFTDHARNDDIATGEWRPLNLDLPPFCFPPPLRVVADGPRPDGTWPDKILALYRLADLPYEKIR